jgi:hypothetical protein
LFAVFKKLELPRKYFILCVIYAAHIIVGILYNGVPAGAVVAGIRTYFRYLPIFLFPCLLQVQDKSMFTNLNLLLLLGILQVPLSVYQRFFLFRGVQTGDVVTGTLSLASSLVIFQITIICYFWALYLMKRIKLKSLLLLSLLIFIPCTINETKAVIILFPVAVLCINLFAKGSSSKLKRFIATPTVLVLLIAIFVPIYDHFIQPKWGYGLFDFFQIEGRLEGYLYKGASGKDPDETVGRIDSLIIASKKISENPMTFVFGLGIGNVTKSFIRNFHGNYIDFEGFGAKMTTWTNILWELGYGGAFWLCIFIFFNISDAMVLNKSQDLRSQLSLTWIGVCVMLSLSLAYVNLIPKNLIFLYAYFSGYVLSESYRSKAIET